jgi:CBS domain-containing protein
MLVRDGMSDAVLVVGPTHTVREAAQRMAARKVGAAVVHDPDNDGVGIITERDVLEALAAGQDPDDERVANHLTTELVFAAPEWPLEKAADAMVRGGFRHLVVLDGGDVAGILAMRDIVRCWTQHGAPTAAG